MSSSIPVNLIRQWCYCPRIVYYIELTNFSVNYPRWVNQGEEFHEKEVIRWQRRNLSRFGLEEGRVYLNHPILSEEKGLHGIADMIIETEKNVFPVEFKLASSQKKRGGLLQLATYAILAEHTFQKPCPYGFLTEGSKSLHKVDITKDLRDQIMQVVSEIGQMLEKGVKPDSSATINQCSNCEYLNHCNDRE